MENDNSTFHIPTQDVPSFERAEVYAFVAPETDDIYAELAAISEEIQQCRSENLQN